MSINTNEISTTPGPSQILEFSVFAAAEQNLAAVFNGAARTIVSELAVDCCHIYRLSSGRHDLQFVAGEGTDRDFVQLAVRATVLGSLERYAHGVKASSGSEGDLASERPVQALATATEHDPVNGISVVIEGETAPFGAVAIFSSGTPRVFSRG